MAGRPKGLPKSGGRTKGTKNIRSFNAWELANRLNIDPLEVLLKFASGDWKGLGYDNEVYHSESATGETKLGYVITPNMRMNAADKACKFLYPTKIETTPTENDTSPEAVTETIARLAKLIT